MGKAISYAKSETFNASSASDTENNKENMNPQTENKIPKRHQNQKMLAKQTHKKLIKQHFEENPIEKDYSAVTAKTEAKSFADIEANMWKNNIKEGRRQKRDFLDISAEDFSKNESVDINGKKITPSTFNIFRDSLREHSEKLLATLNENLPDMNLKEIEQSESESDQNSSDEEVIPLDFRTAFNEDQNKVVIQAKPLQLGADSSKLDSRKKNPSSLDEYLEQVKLEPFKEEDGAVLIEPDVNIQEKFDQIELPFEQENRINNSNKGTIK